MRESPKGGAVVATVVAVLEKKRCPNGQYGSINSRKYLDFEESTRKKGSRSMPKNNRDLAPSVSSAADEDFRTAVEDFDCVAEDVEKIVTRTRNHSIFRTSSLKAVRDSDTLVDTRFSSDFRTNSLGRKKVSTTSSSRNQYSKHQDNNSVTVSDLYDGNTTTKFWNDGVTNSITFRPPLIVPNLDRGTELASRDFENYRPLVEDDYLIYEDRSVRASGVVRVEDGENPDDDEATSSSGSASSSGSSEEDSDSEGEHVIQEGLETITEEERNTASSAQSSHREIDENGSSTTADDESTLKDHGIGWTENTSTHGSTSDLSSTSSERPRNLQDSSTRCNGDFQWIRKEIKPQEQPTMEDLREPIPLTKPPINRTYRDKTNGRRDKAPGSLDRRRPQQNRVDREQKSRSTVLKSPPRLDDFQPCQNWCCSPHENVCFDNFHRRHERIDPQKYGSSPMLMEQRGSHPDLYGDCNRYRHDIPMGCCSYHLAPPYYFYGDRGYRWTPPPLNKPGEQDERINKLQYEKDNLQLQVQVLTEQIEAQSDKIADLEKSLQDRKQTLGDVEEKLQREVLSRSSLETQKLELMTIISDLKLQQASLERENLELRNSQYNNNQDMRKMIPRMSPQPPHTSTPIHHGSAQGLNARANTSPSPVTVGLNSVRRSESTNSALSSDHQPKTPPPTYKRQIDIHYGSLPRQQFISNGGMSVVDSNANPSANGRKGVAFAQTEKIVIDDNSSQIFNKNRGIKKIFGKIKRSGSGNLEDLPGVGEFQRGGVRATAAARLGWTDPPVMQKPDKPFGEWDTENICDWLQDLGLDQYVPEAKRWVKNGQQLQETPINEIEKELNIKNTLHRKKLQLALIDTEVNSSSDPYLTKAGELDTAWVLRWLDDTGLPQHKEAFLMNRVDGRVLHRLTIDDLTLLHVTSLLHVASIKRGIQVLRENNFEAGCLQRRSLPDEKLPPEPKQVALWTTHRVMEWLKAVDLAEYAPNLRGAGVHGGLMVYETKFTAELLAALLSIPPGKTLLRRHLNTHFKELLGKEIIQEKREAESTLGYIPLTPSTKLKVAKKTQFTLKRKKSKGEADYGDLVCPLNPDKNSDDEENGKPRGRGCFTSR